jgi:hypothetical protein
VPDHCAVNKKPPAKAATPAPSKQINKNSNNSDNSSLSGTGSTGKVGANIAPSEMAKPCPCSETVAPAYLRGLNCAAVNRAVNPPPASWVNPDLFYQTVFCCAITYQQIPARAPPSLA